MNPYGDTLFGGSRFVRLALTPVFVLSIVFLPALILQPANAQNWTPEKAQWSLIVVLAIDFVMALMLVGFWVPARYGRWAYRWVAVLVFAAYAVYLGVRLYEEFHPELKAGKHASLFESMLGFVAIGLPCLWYAWAGRFGRRAAAVPPVQRRTPKPGDLSGWLSIVHGAYGVDQVCEPATDFGLQQQFREIGIVMPGDYWELLHQTDGAVIGNSVVVYGIRDVYAARVHDTDYCVLGQLAEEEFFGVITGETTGTLYPICPAKASGVRRWETLRELIEARFGASGVAAQ